MPRAVLLAVGAAIVLLGVAIWLSRSSIETSDLDLESVASPQAQRFPAVAPEVAVSSSSLAKPPDTNTRDDILAERSWAQAVVQALVDRDDAESLVVAALIVQSMGQLDNEFAGSAPNYLQLLRRASNASPSDAAVQWLAWLSCRRAVEVKAICSEAQYESALRAADPGNAFASAAALGRAVRQHDTEAVDHLLALMAKAERFDTYYAAVETLIFNTIESARVPPPALAGGNHSSAQLLALGISRSLPMPPLPMSNACAASTRSTTAQSCLTVATLMRAGDSYAVRRMGLNIAEQLVPFGSRTAVEIGEEQRRLDWLAYQVGQLSYPAEAMQRLLPSAGGEIELWEAWLTENAIPVVPPVNWARPESIAP